MNIVYNDDCMNIMKDFKDNEVDLAIPDPPYGINISQTLSKQSNKQYGSAATKKGNYQYKEWDSHIPEKKYFNKLFKISKNQIIWGGNYFIEYLKNTSCFIVWNKNNTTNCFADCELAWTSFKSAVRKFDYTWNGMIQQNMRDKEIRIHPTQKPVALYKWLLQNYAKPGDLIFDSHVGSGSSRIACYELGFDFIGTELDKDYWEA